MSYFRANPNTTHLERYMEGEREEERERKLGERERSAATIDGADLFSHQWRGTGGEEGERTRSFPGVEARGQAPRQRRRGTAARACARACGWRKAKGRGARVAHVSMRERGWGGAAYHSGEGETKGARLDLKWDRFGRLVRVSFFLFIIFIYPLTI